MANHPQSSANRQHSALRAGTGHDGNVTSFELFFDLVYVFAVTQLSHLLLAHLSVHGALQTALVLLPVWWAWMYTAWATNWLDPDHRAVRLMLLGVMFGSLIMASSIPKAFGDHGLGFAGAYLVIQVLRSVFIVAVAGSNPVLRDNFQRIVGWSVAAGFFWVAGAFADGGTRELIWVVAVIVDYAGPLAGYWVPGVGRSTPQDWQISGDHMAERCQLFLIVALGESILLIGNTLATHPITPSVIFAFIVAFLGSVLLWWVYFDRTAGDARELIENSETPGQLGRSAYTYAHLPMVAGIIVIAVGDELVIAHPGHQAGFGTAATVLGGAALFLAGHGLFKWMVFNVFSWYRMTAALLLTAMIPLVTDFDGVIVAVLTIAVLAAVVAFDTVVARRIDRAETLEDTHHERLLVDEETGLSVSQDD